MARRSFVWLGLFMERILLATALVLAAIIGALLVAGFKLPPPNSLSDWLTPLVAAAAIAQAYFAMWALQGLRHSRRAADAAAASLDLSRDTAQRQLRAYIGMHEQEVAPLTAGQPLRLVMNFRNVGMTPAYDVRIALSVRTVQRDETVDFDVPISTDGFGSRTTLIQGRDLKVDLSTLPNGNFRQPDIDALESGIWIMFVFGCIRYTDAFGQDHVTNFRLCYDTGNTSGPRLAPRRYFFHCQQGNDAT